jgi:dTDP-4-amino-4,6-dideoxygalactose transaminase
MRANYLPFGAPNISQREIDAVARVMRSGWIGMGPETIEFEQELAAFTGAPHVVTVNSCTSALFLSLLVHGVGPGSEVLCPSLTWCSTANAARYLGATPVFCDVDPETLCVSAETIRRSLTARTRAVIPVHFGGLTCDVADLRAALPDTVAIVEDAAHAFGGRLPDGRRVGASGDLTCFSFYANKNLSTAEGGAVALFDSTIAHRLRSLRQHGYSADAWTRFNQSNALLLSAPLAELGYKMNYTDLQAAMGRVQLTRQEEFAERRVAIARCYAQALRELDPDIRLQRGVCDAGHARHLFVVLLPVEKLAIDRNVFVRELRTRNIGAAVHYAPLHQMPLYGDTNTECRLPVTEDLAPRLVSLPMSASMSAADAREVIEAFVEVYQTALASRGARRGSRG